MTVGGRRQPRMGETGGEDAGATGGGSAFFAATNVQARRCFSGAVTMRPFRMANYRGFVPHIERPAGQIISATNASSSET
jgi:hypothetical protein